MHIATGCGRILSPKGVFCVGWLIGQMGAIMKLFCKLHSPAGVSLAESCPPKAFSRVPLVLA